MSIEIGSTAPEFDLPGDGGNRISSAALAGKAYVIYFYPKDMTPGCTTEACDFRDLYSDFADLGMPVIGVSKDSIARHDKFKAKHELNFALASDEEGDLCERYGVWVEKKMYGKTFMGIQRATFLVGSDGKIAQAWHKVKVKEHVQAVLEAARSL